MMPSLIVSVLAGICLFVDTSEASGYCDNNYCPGIKDYCCYDDDYNTVCCSGSDVSDSWWLWFVLAMALVFFISCISCCIRMRRNRVPRRYLIITGEQPAPVVSCTAATYPAYGACSNYGTEGPAPVLVSPVASGQRLPPPYSHVAENKGQPPPYHPQY